MKKLVIVLSLIFYFNSNAAYIEGDYYEGSLYEDMYHEDSLHENMYHEELQDYEQEAFLAGCLKAAAYIAIGVGYLYLVHRFAFGEEEDIGQTEQCVREGV